MHFEILISARNFLTASPLFVLGFMLIFGFFMGKLAEKTGLPNITGYIIAGLLMGNSITGIVDTDMEHSLHLITELALSIIAITIGGEFLLSKLKKMGKGIIVLTLFEQMGALIMVAGVLYLLGLPLAFALLMGAISSATAPAATVAIVDSLKAKGKFIDYLYGIVALDDAGAVILYGILFAVATVIMGTTSSSGLTALISIFKAFFSIIASVFLGLAAGWLLYQFVKKLYSKNEILIISLGIIIVTTGISTIMGYSPLLANMASGALLINITSRNRRIFDALKSLSPPIYPLFFIVAGTELKPSVISQSSVIFLGIAYVLARIAGKYAGVYTIGKSMGMNKKIYKNLGFCLMPQAGVALGLIMLLKTSPLASHLSHANQLILTNMINIVLFSTFINEILGPFVSKQGILRGTNLISNKKIKKSTQIHT